MDVLLPQPDDTYRSSRYLTANLMYQPIRNVTIGVEVDYGRLTVKDGRGNSATRLQGAVQYDLVK